MTDTIIHPEIQPHSSEPGSKNRYIIMLMILAGVLMAVVDGSVVSIALPTITGYFNVSVAESEWVMTSYLVTLTSLLLIFGKVAERTGKARLFGLGIALFTLSSLACGISSSLGQLILFRVIQSAGAAMMFSISAAMVFQVFPRGEQGRAMGYIGATVAIGSIIGPSLGGFIVEILGWQYIFLINVPIGMVLMALSARYLRVEERRSSRLNMDWPGALALVLFMVSLMAFLGELASSFAIQPATVALAAICLVSLIAFVAVERRQKVPLLDLSVFGYPRFVLPSISMIIFFVSNLMVSVLGPFYFEGVMGYNPSQVGLIYLIVPAIMVIGSPFTGWLYDKHHNRYYAALGMAVLALSLMLMGYMAGTAVPNPEMLLLTFVPVGIGAALFQSPNNTEVMRALPREKMNIASSFTATVRNLGMALGVSLSSVLVSLQLAQAGYFGAILDAGPGLLSSSISRVMMLAGALCIVGTVTCIIRGVESA
ncbi:MAG TPA: MFS transporter [Methanotrichaceae archaeon]|nr:MFS transporter [Methanotrichaceae archaeon]